MRSYDSHVPFFCSVRNAHTHTCKHTLKQNADGMENHWQHRARRDRERDLKSGVMSFQLSGDLADIRYAIPHGNFILHFWN